MSSRMPEWIAPMAATLTQDRFTGPEWTFERKLDFSARSRARLLPA